MSRIGVHFPNINALARDPGFPEVMALRIHKPLIRTRLLISPRNFRLDRSQVSPLRSASSSARFPGHATPPQTGAVSLERIQSSEPPLFCHSRQ